MSDSYSIEITLKHRIPLDERDPALEIIQEYESKIICMRDDEEAMAGTFDFYVANVALAVNAGVDIVDIADSIDEDLFQYCNALFAPGTASEVREEVVEQFDEPLGNRMLMLHLAKVLPEYRGKRLALVAAHKIIEQFGDGLVVAKAQPLQHHKGFNDEKEMAYDTFESARDAAVKRLTRHWCRLGFKPIGDTGYLALNTAYRLPVPKLFTGKKPSPPNAQSKKTSSARRRR